MSNSIRFRFGILLTLAAMVTLVGLTDAGGPIRARRAASCCDAGEQAAGDKRGREHGPDDETERLPAVGTEIGRRLEHPVRAPSLRRGRRRTDLAHEVSHVPIVSVLHDLAVGV